MKRNLWIVAMMLASSRAGAYEQAMHFYLAHEAIKNLKNLNTGAAGSGRFYRHDPATEVQTLEAIQASFLCGQRSTVHTVCKPLADRIQLLRAQSQSSNPNAGLRTGAQLFFPFATKKPPFNTGTDGALVRVPFEFALNGLGIDGFMQHFFAGVAGADNFPDFVVGGTIAHVDWASKTGGALWKSWQWGEHVWNSAKNQALFDEIANEWDLSRPYWGTKYATKAALATRVKQEAEAFSYGYWIHQAQDAVSHEMVSSFNGGAFWWANVVGSGIGVGDDLVERRHSAVESYMLEKVKPWIWPYAATLTNIRIPVPFIRKVLMEGAGLAKAPIAAHFLAFDKLTELYNTIFTCGTPSLTEGQCDGKQPPAVYKLLDCVGRDAKCAEEVLCYLVKNAFPNHRQRLQDAKDAWLLMSLAIAKDSIQLGIHPVVASPIVKPTIMQNFRSYLRDYGFAGAYQRTEFAKDDPNGNQLLQAITLYLYQFILPAVLPVTFDHDKSGKLNLPNLDAAFLQQIDITNCGWMGYTNLVSICEFAKDLLKTTVTRLIERFSGMLDSIKGVFGDALLNRGKASESQSTKRDAPTEAPKKPAELGFFAGADTQLNRVYPCAKGSLCSRGANCPSIDNKSPECAACQGTGGGQTLPNQCHAIPPEMPVAREIKQRLERFVGQDALKASMKDGWEDCRGPKWQERPFATGKNRGDCFSNRVFAALLSGRLSDAQAPVHASPWLRRALMYTQISMLSGPGPLKDLAEKSVPSFGELCGGKLAAKGHPLNGVMASLVGDRFRAPKPEAQRYTNRFHDELAWGGFALYSAECKSVYEKLVLEISDTDGDGVNDIYDTCPDVKASADSVRKNDPNGDHVGANCTAASPLPPAAPPNATPPTDPTAACRAAVDGRIPWNAAGNTKWSPQNVEQLCRGGLGEEPARCFERLMRGKVNWGGGTTWLWENALNLCKGSQNAGATIACFEGKIRARIGWAKAIAACGK